MLAILGMKVRGEYRPRSRLQICHAAIIQSLTFLRLLLLTSLTECPKSPSVLFSFLLLSPPFSPSQTSLRQSASVRSSACQRKEKSRFITWDKNSCRTCTSVAGGENGRAPLSGHVAGDGRGGAGREKAGWERRLAQSARSLGDARFPGTLQGWSLKARFPA